MYPLVRVLILFFVCSQLHCDTWGKLKYLHFSAWKFDVINNISIIACVVQQRYVLHLLVTGYTKLGNSYLHWDEK